jgi:regulatory protein
MINRNSEEYLKARLSAFKFITFKRRTIKETENKLKSLEVNPEYIEDIIEELIELEYLNDEIYVQKFIEKSNKLSVNMIKLKLREKGIDRDLIENYFNKNAFEEIDKIINLLKKKDFSFDLSLDEQNKIKVYLLRKGFNKHDIEKAISILRGEI